MDVETKADEVRLPFTFDLQRFAGERTEPATPKRRSEARKKGQVPRSQDLATAAVLLGIFALLHRINAGVYTSLANFMAESLAATHVPDLSVGQVVALGLDIVVIIIRTLAPIFLVALAVGLLANFLQVGFLFSASLLAPSFDKMNPLKGLQRLFSPRALLELLKSLAKILVIGWVAYQAVRPAYDTLTAISDFGLSEVFIFVESLVYRVGLRVGLALLVLAIFDYGYQRWDYEKNLRMSKQEIKEEFKEQEGDPKVKAQIRQRQRQMAQRRMMQQVPQADVIITNPTHIAVALKYDQKQMKAPQVVAMGADYVAERIKQIATESGVVIVENRPLARALYQTAEIGQAVPVELYQAVAEALAFVYRLRRRRA